MSQRLAQFSLQLYGPHSTGGLRSGIRYAFLRLLPVLCYSPPFTQTSESTAHSQTYCSLPLYNDILSDSDALPQFRSNWSVDPSTGQYTALLVKSPTGIPTDPPLTSKGVQQSKELADYLSTIHPPVDVIYSSPFYRCLQTLKPFTDRHLRGGKTGKIRIDRGIGEFFGRADWEHPHPPTVDILTPHFDYLDQDHVSTHIPASKGEMIVELHVRVRKALDHIITTLDNDPAQPKTLLICSHAATIIAAGRVLTGQMPEDPDTDDFQCFTAGLSKFVRKSTDPAKGVAGNWDCVLNSETSFLSGGAERGWKFNGDESFVAFPDEPTGVVEAPKL